MWHWLLQGLLLLTFATVSVSVERRRTGLIMSGFALLYLGQMKFTTLMDDFSPPLYALWSVAIDLLAIRLLLAFGSKGAKPQAFILCAFVTTHFMAYLYTVGLPSIIDEHQYIVVTFTLAILHIVVASPGAWDVICDTLDKVQEILENYRPVPAFACVYPDWENGGSVPRYAGSGAVYRASGPADFQTVLHNRGQDRSSHSMDQRRSNTAGQVV